jgi:hypothetical protein
MSGAARRMLHFTQAGLKSQEMEIAPDEVGEVIKSKRHHLIEDEDQNLDSNMVELDEGTRARNRAFQDKLDEVWSQTSGWEAKLRTEEKEAEESINAVRQYYEKVVVSFEADLQKELHEAFDRIDDNLYPPQVQRTVEIDKGVDDYFQYTVPDAIEQQTGIIAKKLKKQYEAFNIEQQKEKKRELKFVSKANHHIQTTAQKFTDEAALAKACFYTLEDDVVETERRAARMHLRRWDESVTAIIAGRNVIAKEVVEREREDVDLLDCVIETQQLLQRTVLENFGVDPSDAPLPKRGPKLRARLEKAASRRNSRASLGEESKGEASGNGSVGEGKEEDANFDDAGEA